MLETTFLSHNIDVTISTNLYITKNQKFKNKKKEVSRDKVYVGLQVLSQSPYLQGPIWAN